MEEGNRHADIAGSLTLVPLFPAAPSAAPSPIPAPPPAGPTPEKLAYWSQRLHRAARLRTSRPASPSPSRAEDDHTPASSPGTSGDEVARWHTPASALGPRSKAHPEESATSPSSLIRARRRYAGGESSGMAEPAEGCVRELGKGPALVLSEETLAERLAEMAV
ncbi:hypothetical protein H632_c393p0 [Helicosporidium sp. ATCC 50920]|nr:hypothetical protein H632_c393p0 [Helicosporidium sp. ATCC 50920]|eukprot:KDD76018.1 hypothetical protein H632_c393p0 [Helicosporidium sp. ATCC 50920]